MKFVYPLKTGFDSKELRYSIRSVAKFYPDAEIIILGRKPNWLRKATEYRIDEKPFSKPADNVWNKILMISKRLKGESFVWMNDDIILTKEFDWIGSQLSSGTLQERIDGMKSNNLYTSRIKRTISLLEGLNYQQMCYDIHQPMHIMSDFILWMESHFKVKETGILFKSVYGILTFNQYKQLTFPHSKINSKDDYSENMVYFSTSDEFKDYDLLESLYPEKCKFELA